MWKNRTYSNICLVLFSLLTFLCASRLFPEERLQGTADEVEFLTVNGQLIRKFTGNVRLYQGKSVLACRRATWYDREARIVLEDSVIIDDGEKVLTADKVTYYEKLKKEVACGNVRIVDSLRTLIADRVTFWENEDQAIADGNVKIIENEQRMILTGGHAEYFRAIDSVLVTFNPVLIQNDSLGQEDLRITGKVMELAGQGDLALVSDEVRIVSDSTEATCGIAEFWRKQNKVILRLEPEVLQDGQIMRGDSIELFFEQQELELVRVCQHAEIISRVDSIDTVERWNKLSGQYMTIYIKNRQIEKIIVENQATSWYHIIEDQKYKGLNKVTGDQLNLFLADGKLWRIRITSDPGISSGIFYPGGKSIPAEEVKTKKSLN